VAATVSLLAMRLALVGGGRMGEALAVGLLEHGWEAEELAVAEVDADRHHELEARLPGVRVVRNPAWAAGDAEVLVLAVKPKDAVAALASCAEVLPDGALVLSIAAGVTIASLQEAVPGRPVVRAMPNTGALVGRSATAIAAGPHATELDLETCERVLGSVGVVVRVPEEHLDAVTGLSGSGPAYVFLLAEAMIEAGVLVGLPRDTSEQLVRQTILGSGTLLTDTDTSPEALRAAVTSPGGTTAAGLAILETHGVRGAFLEAITAATRRSQELGQG
jgi:pyrroline-5-carboxylate reductase